MSAMMSAKRLALVKANLESILKTPESAKSFAESMSDSSFKILHQECLAVVNTLEKIYTEVEGSDDAGDSMMALYHLLDIE